MLILFAIKYITTTFGNKTETRNTFVRGVDAADATKTLEEVGRLLGHKVIEIRPATPEEIEQFDAAVLHPYERKKDDPQK